MKAIAIFSGGLDSSLAIKAVQNQGIEVIAVHFLIPFLKHDDKSVPSSPVKKIASHLGCELKIVILANEYLEMFKEPKYGYGKQLNPCIDCKILMLRYAKRIMAEAGASFIITGEVLGQRPMSQNRQSLQIIERESGLEGFLVRPLSALLLPKTIAQEKGWLKKEFLFDIQGRSRKLQIALAKKWEIKEYQQPAGGCLLTDAGFCRKLKDIINHNSFTIREIELLKVGRHFRVSPKFKLVVGRNEEENKKLLELGQDNDRYFEPEVLAGPVGLGRGLIDQEMERVSAQLIARYTAQGKEVKVMVGSVGSKDKKVILTKSMDEAKIKSLMI